MNLLNLITLIGIIPGIHAWIDRFFLKPRIKLKAEIRQFDYSKGMNTYLDPVNELQLFISNHSKHPIVIHDIKLIYKNIQESEKGELDRLANSQINKVKNTKLNQSEEIIFKLRYSNKYEKLILDHLKDIKLILTSSDQYKVGEKILEPLIEELKELKPPNSENLALARRRQKMEQGLCNR